MCRSLQLPCSIIYNPHTLCHVTHAVIISMFSFSTSHHQHMSSYDTYGQNLCSHVAQSSHGFNWSGIDMPMLFSVTGQSQKKNDCNTICKHPWISEYADCSSIQICMYMYVTQQASACSCCTAAYSRSRLLGRAFTHPSSRCLHAAEESKASASKQVRIS